jgi:hypothetical protein
MTHARQVLDATKPRRAVASHPPSGHSAWVAEPIILRARWLVAACWIAAVVFLLLFVAIAVAGSGPDPGPVDYLGTVTLGVIVSLVCLRATRMRVELNDRGITVFHWFTTEFVPWVDVADVSVDYGGLQLIRTDGDVVTAGSMGK